MQSYTPTDVYYHICLRHCTLLVVQEVKSLTSLRWHHPQTPHSATSHTTHTVNPTDTRNTLRDKEPVERHFHKIRAVKHFSLALLFNLSCVNSLPTSLHQTLLE